MLQGTKWTAFSPFPVRIQIKAIVNELNILEDVLNNHKTDLRRQHGNDSTVLEEGRPSSLLLRCIQQSDVSMAIGDGDSMALIEFKFLPSKKSHERVSFRVARRRKALEVL